jgi:hypothetical protein
MINTKKCIKCERVTFLNQMFCHEHYLELYRVPLNFRKLKERKWRDFITFYLKDVWNVDVKWNKKLCNSNVLPDFHFEYMNVLFIIEIDENQHNTGVAYSTDIEENRYKQFGTHEKVVVLRINPDETKRHPAIWRKISVLKNPGEVEEIVLTNDEEFQRRQDIFKSVVKYKLLQCFYKKSTSFFAPLFNSYNNSTTQIEAYFLFFD